MNDKNQKYCSQISLSRTSSAFNIFSQITSFQIFIIPETIITGCVIISALIATQIVVFASGPILVLVIAVQFLLTFWCECTEWRVVEIAWVFTIFSYAAFNAWIGLALFGLDRKELWIWTHKFPQFTVDALIVATTACGQIIVELLININTFIIEIEYFNVESDYITKGLYRNI